MTTPEDRELIQIGKESAEEARQLYPDRTISLRAKALIALAAIILSINAGLGLFNTYQVDRTIQCETRLSKSLTQIATDDRSATRDFINGTVHVKDQATLNELLQRFNASSAVNDTRRATLLATNCN